MATLFSDSRDAAATARWPRFLGIAGMLVASTVSAQPQVIVEHPGSNRDSGQPCLPVEKNVVLEARIEVGEIAGRSVRLYFRRLNPDPEGEYFYYVDMLPKGDGRFWTTFPKPEDRQQLELTEGWWRGRRYREQERQTPPGGALPRARDGDWLGRCDLDPLRRWLWGWLEAPETPAVCSSEEVPEDEALRRPPEVQEAAEYYVAVHDAAGRPVEVGGEPFRSSVYLVGVLPDDRCEARLNPRQRGWAANLTAGETVEQQRGEKRTGKGVFHWLCDGITARIDVHGIPRPDKHCQKCVIGSLLPLGSRPFALAALAGPAEPTLLRRRRRASPAGFPVAVTNTPFE